MDTQLSQPGDGQRSPSDRLFCDEFFDSRGSDRRDAWLARYAKPDEPHDIQFLKSRRFVIWGTVGIDEMQLRQWFARIFACGPTQEDIDAGFRLPSNEMRRELGKCLPDVGFKLTGDVDFDAGFAISWDGGWVRGNAAGCLLPVDFIPNHEQAIILRREIEALLDTDCRAGHIRGEQ